MGSAYSLMDETAGRELIGGSGRGIMELMWFMDHPSVPGDPVRIFVEWEHQGVDCFVPDPVRFSASAVVKDADTIIDALSGIEDDRRFGAFLASEWIEIFKDVKSWALDHATHAFRSQYYE
mgnify:CR=1 FL=1